MCRSGQLSWPHNHGVADRGLNLGSRTRRAPDAGTGKVQVNTAIRSHRHSGDPDYSVARFGCAALDQGEGFGCTAGGCHR